VKKEGSIVGVDIGTTKVAVAVGQIKEGMVRITAVGSAANSGLRKGSVVDIEETVSAISGALEDAERASGEEITSCYASINGSQVVSSDSKGVIAVGRADGEIQAIDAERVIEAAKSVALPPNYEIIHAIPKYYSIDGHEAVKDPSGMSGIRLEVQAHVVGIALPALKNLSRALAQSGLEVDGLIFAPLAAAKGYLSKKQKEIGVILIDIGAANTAIAVFEEGTLIHSKVIPIGSGHITNDIAIGLKITIEAAERIKLKEIDAMVDEVKESEKIELKKYEPSEKEMPNRRYVCEIAEARLNELFSMIRDELKQIQRDEMLPAGVVLVGGGARLKNLQQFVKGALGLPAQTGKSVYEVSGIIDSLDDPEYATAIGLMLWGIDEREANVSNKGRLPVNFGKIGGAFDKVKDIFKNFIP